MVGAEAVILRPWGKDKKNHKMSIWCLQTTQTRISNYLTLVKHWQATAPRPNVCLSASGALPEQVGTVSQGDQVMASSSAPTSPLFSQCLVPSQWPAVHCWCLGSSWSPPPSWAHHCRQLMGGLSFGLGDHVSPFASGQLPKLIHWTHQPLG